MGYVACISPLFLLRKHKTYPFLHLNTQYGAMPIFTQGTIYTVTEAGRTIWKPAPATTIISSVVATCAHVDDLRIHLCEGSRPGKGECELRRGRPFQPRNCRTVFMIILCGTCKGRLMENPTMVVARD